MLRMACYSPPDSAPKLALFGRLDHQAAPALAERLEQFTQEDLPSLRLDLSGLEYVGSSGLHTLVRARRVFSSRGGILEICGYSPLVEEIIIVAGLRQQLLGPTREPVA